MANQFGDFNYGLGLVSKGAPMPGFVSGQPNNNAPSKKAVEQGGDQVCTFFLRTGLCAYADRCKFRHPLDRLPPTLNSRGYPMRASEPDCAHYLKKGWCAFGATCKFNHPELNTTLLGPRVPVANPNIISPMAAVGNFAVPSAAAYPAAASVPTMLYVHSNQIMQGPAGAAPMGYPAAMQPNAAFMRAFDGLGTAPARI